MAAHWMAATPPSESIDVLLDMLDKMWVGVWMALSGIRSDQTALRDRIERRLYAPAPDGFGHRRCRDAHRSEYASGVVRGLPAIYSVLANHNLRSFGTSKVDKRDFMMAAAALGVPALDDATAARCSTSAELARKMIGAAKSRNATIEKETKQASALRGATLATDPHAARAHMTYVGHRSRLRPSRCWLAT